MIYIVPHKSHAYDAILPKNYKLNGYGFVTNKEIAEYMFLHSSMLNDFKFHSLIQG